MTGESSMDQRMYASGYGRFTSPDRYLGSAGPGVPGSWNRYAYVLGDPINLTDRTGMYVDCDDDSCDLSDCDGDAISCMMANDGGGDVYDSGAVFATTVTGVADSVPPGPPVIALAPLPVAATPGFWTGIWSGLTGIAEGIGAVVSPPVVVAVGIVVTPVSAGGSDERCWEQYEADLAICRQLGSSSCYNQAQQRYAACITNKPMPPFPYSPPAQPRPPAPLPVPKPIKPVAPIKPKDVLGFLG